MEPIRLSIRSNDVWMLLLPPMAVGNLSRFTCGGTHPDAGGAGGFIALWALFGAYFLFFDRCETLAGYEDGRDVRMV